MNVDDPAVQAIAEAIATAEGFFVPGSRPSRDNNPGDLTQDTIGAGVGWDGPFVIYPDESTGWDALFRQVQLMFGGSRIYNSGMTIAQVAGIGEPTGYTATNQNTWALNVASYLGVSTDTTLDQIAAIYDDAGGIGNPGDRGGGPSSSPPPVLSAGVGSVAAVGLLLGFLLMGGKHGR